MTRVLALLALLALAAAGSADGQTADRTVRAGMTADEVRAAWGEPQASRQRGGYTYLVFPTSCLPGCGTHDIVILEDGRVVDAIARSDGRRYEGPTALNARPPGYTAPEAPR